MPTLRLALHIEAGTIWHKRFGVWLPDGLHIWVNRRGVHLFWLPSTRANRISFDRMAGGEAAS